MRLFLSSENLGNYPEVFLNMVGKGNKLALVENAKDYVDEPERKLKVQQHIEQFSDQGFDVEEIDLRGYFDRQDSLLEKIKEFGGVFVFGGNTFILRRAMAASGFDKVLQDLVLNGQLSYGGSSAGSCVTAKTLHGIEFGDRPQPEDVPDGYPNKEIIWDGLGFVNFMVVPHYGSTWWGKEADECINYLKEHSLPYKILKDGQVIVIDADKEEFLK
ncbi:MAG TPA: Type 1 glutamine amidotransferase-like domain-containing protein [Candidatus Binatia bacterium]|nr:Type 1 glutamine amidotransferase-like domain-containing protein [Candidatus Binatia bacterium]